MSRPKNYLEAVGYRSIPLEDSEKPVKFSISAATGLQASYRAPPFHGIKVCNRWSETVSFYARALPSSRRLTAIVSQLG
jgi:hypothetical protein